MLTTAEVPQDAGSYASFVFACDSPSLRRPPFFGAGAACARASAPAQSVAAVAALPRSSWRRSRLIIVDLFDIASSLSQCGISKLRSADPRRQTPRAILAQGVRSAARAPIDVPDRETDFDARRDRRCDRRARPSPVAEDRA